MRAKLTAATLPNYKPTNEVREVTDFFAPWLRLRIQPKPHGTRSWIMRFRRPNGKAGILTLGPVDLSDKESADEPQLGSPLTLAAARQLAAKINRERQRGIDVIAERAAAKSRQKAEHLDRAENTFAAGAIAFIREHRTRRWGTRPRRWAEDAVALGLRWRRDADPAKAEPEVIKGGLADVWRDKSVADIDAHDIFQVVNQSRKSGIPGLRARNHGTSESRARRLHGALSGLFRWLARGRRVATNPCVGLERPHAPPPRQRRLSDNEIRWFWRATGKCPQPFAAAFRLMLLSGARLNEVAGMCRSELGAEGWLIPQQRAKNHREVLLPLPVARARNH
jgi:integrase